MHTLTMIPRMLLRDGGLLRAGVLAMLLCGCCATAGYAQEAAETEMPAVQQEAPLVEQELNGEVSAETAAVEEPQGETAPDPENVVSAGDMAEQPVLVEGVPETELAVSEALAKERPAELLPAADIPLLGSSRLLQAKAVRKAPLPRKRQLKRRRRRKALQPRNPPPSRLSRPRPLPGLRKRPRSPRLLRYRRKLLRFR
ncbi:hypothetical protein ACFL43_05110 [Thermodesulfobacteriota bacterium]